MHEIIAAQNQRSTHRSAKASKFFQMNLIYEKNISTLKIMRPNCYLAFK